MLLVLYTSITGVGRCSFSLYDGQEDALPVCRGRHQTQSTTTHLFEGETPGRIVIRLQPHAHLDIQIDVKSPGLGDSVEQATLTHRYPDWLGVDGYEKLLFDSINGDQSHFVHSEEVIESWRIVDDLTLHW